MKKRIIRQLNIPFKSRLSDEKGVSLAELLVVILIMGFLTLAIVAGVGTASKVYNASKTYSESRVLANSVMEELRNIVEYGYNISISENNILTFDSKAYGKEANIGISSDSGRLYLTYSALSSTYYPLQDKAYNGYYIAIHNTNDESGGQAGTPLFALDGNDILSISFDVLDSRTKSVQASIVSAKIRLLNYDVTAGSSKDNTGDSGNTGDNSVTLTDKGGEGHVLIATKTWKNIIEMTDSSGRFNTPSGTVFYDETGVYLFYNWSGYIGSDVRKLTAAEFAALHPEQVMKLADGMPVITEDDLITYYGSRKFSTSQPPKTIYFYNGNYYITPSGTGEWDYQPSGNWLKITQ